MKKIFFALICFSLFASIQSYAQTSGPQFKFKDGDTYDFGAVALGPDVTHNFEFTNTGNAPLIIQSASPSCSCTTPEWPKEPILPGKTGIIKVGFHTTGHPGSFTKQVYILSNATNNPNGEKRYTINIKGVVTDKK